MRQPARPHQFKNAPGRPLSPEESRARLAWLVKGEQIKGLEKKELGGKFEKERPEPKAEKPPKRVTKPVMPSPLPKPSKPSIKAEKKPEEFPKLSLTSQEIQKGLKAKITEAIRWLAEWCVRQIKIFRRPDLVFLGVTLPSENEIEIPAAEQMFASFASLVPQGFLPVPNKPKALSFEIVAEPEEIRFLAVVPPEWQDFVEKQVHGAYPVAEITKVAEYNIFGRKGKVTFGELKTVEKPYFPIKTHEDLETDTLSAITSSVSKLDEGEAAAIQILIQPAGDSWRRRGQSFLTSAQAQGTPEKPKVPVDQKIIEAVQKKIGKLGFKTVIRLVAVGKDSFSANSHLKNMIGSFEQFTHPSLGRFVKKRVWFKRGFMRGFLWRHFPKFDGSILNIEELASVFHFPGKEVKTPHIKWLLSKKAAAPQELPLQGLYLGQSIFRGVEKKVYLARDDRRRHMYILGQTGTGKSELLKFLAQQDIKNGEGVCFIDPHGQAAEELLAMIPKERAEDVIYFNSGDLERPFGLNILEAKTEEAKHMAINSFIALLYKLYDPQHTGIMGPILERAIRNVMLTAMEEEGNTLVEVLRLLTDPDFAKEKIPLISDPLVKRYWTDQLAKTSDFHKSEQLGYFVSKFDRFVTEKLMRNIIGQGKSSFDFREVMDEGKILLVNLAKGKIGDENSNFLGLILVPRILGAAMSRVDLPEAERRDFYLYVDEFQNFATDYFAEILAEARKYRLNLIVGNQYIGQILEDKIKDAVFGNVGTKVCFRIGPDDAEYMEKQFTPVFEQSDFLNLPTGQTYATLLAKGQPTAPFSLKTDWEAMCAMPKDPEIAQKIVDLSRLRFGRDREIVEAEIKTRAKLE